MSTVIPGYQPFSTSSTKASQAIIAQLIGQQPNTISQNTYSTSAQQQETLLPSQLSNIILTQPSPYNTQKDNPVYSDNKTTTISELPSITIQTNGQIDDYVKKTKQNGDTDLISDYLRQIEESKQNVEAKDEQIQKLVKIIDSKDIQIQQLKEEQLQKVFNSQQSQVIITQNTASEVEVSRLRQQNQDLVSENQKLSILVQQRSAQFDQEKQEILTQLSTARNEAASLKQQTALLTSGSSTELDAARAKAQLFEKTNLDLNGQVRQLSIQVDTFKQQAIELERLRSQQNALANNSEFIQKLEAENQSLRNQLYSASQTNIYSSQQDINSLETKLKELQATLDRERLANESSKQNFQRIISEFEQKQINLSSSQQNQEELYNLSQQLKIKNQDAVDLAGLGDSLRNQLLQKDDLIESLISKIQQSDQYRVENESLKTQLSTIRAQYDTELSSLRDNNIKIMVMLVQSQAGLESASQNLISITQDYKSLENDNILLAQKCNESQTALIDKQNIEREIHGLTQTLEALSNSSKEKDRRVELLVRQVEDNEFKIKQYSEKDAKIQQLNVLISEKDAGIQQLLIQQNEVNKQIQNCKVQLDQKDTVIQMLTKQLNERESTELLQRQLQEAQIVIQNQQSQLRDVDNLRRQIDGLRGTIAEKDTEINNLQRQLRDVDGNRRQSDLDKVALLEKESRIQVLVRQLNEYEYSIRNLQAENNDLKVALSKNQSNNNSNNPELLQRIVLLQSTLDAQTAKVKQLEQQPKVDENAASREQALYLQLNQIKSQYEFSQNATIQLNKDANYMKELLQKQNEELIYLRQQSQLAQQNQLLFIQYLKYSLCE